MSKSVKMKKKNRILDVESSRAASFLMQGYDQIDENGEIVKRATGGRSVSLAEYNKTLEELEALKASDSSEQLKEAKKEIKSLEAKVKKLEEEVAKAKETTK